MNSPDLELDPQLIEVVRNLADDAIEFYEQLGETLSPMIDDLTMAFGLELIRQDRERLARTRSSKKRRRVERSIRQTRAEMTRAGQRRAQRIKGDSE